MVIPEVNGLRCNAVVVVPPVEDFYFTWHRFSALGAQIVFNIVKKYLPSASMLNFPLLRKKPLSAPLPSALEYLHEHLIDNETGNCSFFRKYQHFGPDIDTCVSMILETDPSVCLISCFAYCYSDMTLQIAKKLKAVRKNIVIVAGGAGVSAYPEYFLNADSIDYAVVGEAEVALPQLMEFVLYTKGNCAAIPNIAWKENGQIKKSGIRQFTDTSTIVPCITVTGESKDTVYLSTTLSRGCTFKCQFCSNHLSQGSTFRTVNLELFENELFRVAAAYNLSGMQIRLNFEDDNILLDYEFLKAIIKKCRSVLTNVKFTFENGIDYRLLSIDRCKELLTLGVCQFNFSIATTDSAIAENEMRISHFEQLDELYVLLKEHAIPVITYFICGFPSDTPDTIVKNLLYLLQRPTLSGISLFYAVPGLPAYQNSTVEKNLGMPCRFAGASAFPWNGSLSTETLVTAFRLSRLVNMIKSETKSDTDRILIEAIVKDGVLYTVKKGCGKEKLFRVESQDNHLVTKFTRAITDSGLQY